MFSHHTSPFHPAIIFKLKAAALFFCPRSLTALLPYQIWRVRPALLFPSGGREKPNGTDRLRLPSRPPADWTHRDPVLSPTWLPLSVTREPPRAVFQPATHAYTHLPTTHTLAHAGVDSSRGGGAEERLQPANQGSAVQLPVQCLLRSLPASLLCKGWYQSLLGFLLLIFSLLLFIYFLFFSKVFKSHYIFSTSQVAYNLTYILAHF